MYVTNIIHPPILYTAYFTRSQGAYPRSLGAQDKVHPLQDASLSQSTIRDTQPGQLEMIIILQGMYWDWARKPEYAEETPKAWEVYANSTHNTLEVGIKPLSLEVLAKYANHKATIQI